MVHWGLYHKMLQIRFCSKLVWLPKPVKVTDNNKKTLAYYVICLVSVHYKFAII